MQFEYNLFFKGDSTCVLCHYKALDAFHVRKRRLLLSHRLEAAYTVLQARSGNTGGRVGLLLCRSINDWNCRGAHGRSPG